MNNKGIYGILNIINNKIYIGSSKNLSRRKREHFNELRSNKHSNKYLQRAFNKYGENNFKFLKLETNIEIDNLIERENYWVNLKNSLNRDFGYNLQLPLKEDSFEHNSETKELLRRIAYEQYTGKKYESNKNDYIQWKAKLRSRQLTREQWLEPFKILQIDKLTGKVIQEFKQVNDICKLYNCKVNKIKDVVKGRTTSYKGFVYVYKSEYDSNKDYRILPKRQYKERIKVLYQYDINYNFIKKWNSVQEVVKEFNLKVSSVYTALSKKYIMKGYYWTRDKL